MRFEAEILDESVALDEVEQLLNIYLVKHIIIYVI